LKLQKEKLTADLEKWYFLEQRQEYSKDPKVHTI
jgi:hypothetical protein